MSQVRALAGEFLFSFNQKLDNRQVHHRVSRQNVILGFREVYAPVLTNSCCKEREGKMHRTNSNKVLLSALLLTGMLISPVTVFSEQAASPTVPAHHKEGHEHRPEIHKAIKKLNGAKEDLEKAAHDFGGHRVAAIKDIDHALSELHLALESDKK